MWGLIGEPAVFLTLMVLLGGVKLAAGANAGNNADWWMVNGTLDALVFLHLP